LDAHDRSLLRARRDAPRPAPVETFWLSVDHEPGRSRVRLGGDLDLAAMGRLRTVLRSLVHRSTPVIELDLAEVDLLETATAASLAREQEAARSSGVRLTLRGARGVPARLLALAGLDVAD
jgi:anti-anti-sigma factor